MLERNLETKFGAVRFRVYRIADGWKAMLVGHHRVPWVPVLDGPVAQSVDEAADQLLRALQRLEPLH